MANDNRNRSDGDWIEYRRLVLAELNRLGEDISDISKEGKALIKEVEHNIKEDLDALQALYNERVREHNKLRDKVTRLEIRSGIWGALAGALAAIGGFLVKFLA